MKKLLLIVLGLIVLLLATAVTIPIIYKDDIQKELDNQIAANLNADVFYDTDAIGLSLFTNFPDLTFSVGNFGLIGVGQFKEDTLLSVNEFSLTIDIVSVINGENIIIKNFLLDELSVNILVLEDGSANYDIMKETEASSDTEDESSAASSTITIQRWELANANISYDDQPYLFSIDLIGLNHVGSGDFGANVFDMVTQTTINQFSTSYDGVAYISNKELTADLTMEMDLDNMKFSFKENHLGLNNFGFQFDGWVSMPEDDIDMDITYFGEDVTMSSIISLIPGAYTEYLEGITASGTVGFNGYVKGTFNDDLMPAVNMAFNIENGKIAYSDYPIPMEQIQMDAVFDMPSADLTTTSFVMNEFSMLIDGETLSSSLIFKDLEDYFWDFKVDGNIDLEKMMAIFPMEDTDLKGKINAALATSGRMSDLDAERYEKLSSSGSMTISDFYYQSSDLPQGFGITNTTASFDPKQIALTNFQGNAGKTDLNMSGVITNYLQYALDDSAAIMGQLDFRSAYVDVDEWMYEEEGGETGEAGEPADTAEMEVVRIPTNIDFVLTSTIDQIIYDGKTLNDFNGALVIRDGSLRMDRVKFDILDGQFEMNGLYATAGQGNPIYDFDLKIRELSIPKAYSTFNTIQQLAPFAKTMTGNFSTDFKIGGELGEDMMPVYETMQGAGLLSVAQAAMKDVKILSTVSNFSSLDKSDGNLNLKDVLLNAEIRDGSVFVEPFDVNLSGYTTTISGSNTIVGALDYKMVLKNVPTGAAGDAINSALASFTGGQEMVSSAVDLNLGVLGTFIKPSVKMLGVTPSGGGTSMASSAKSAVTNLAKEKVAEQKEKVVQEAEEKVEEAKAVVEEQVQEKKEEAKEVVNEQKEEVTDKAKNAVKGLLKKKKGGGK
ncbi:MAG: AsmA family protein [Cyclobacteriaceae bacterium]